MTTTRNLIVHQYRANAGLSLLVSTGASLAVAPLALVKSLTIAAATPIFLVALLWVAYSSGAMEGERPSREKQLSAPDASTRQAIALSTTKRRAARQDDSQRTVFRAARDDVLVKLKRRSGAPVSDRAIHLFTVTRFQGSSLNRSSMRPFTCAPDAPGVIRVPRVEIEHAADEMIRQPKHPESQRRCR